MLNLDKYKDVIKKNETEPAYGSLAWDWKYNPERLVEDLVLEVESLRWEVESLRQDVAADKLKEAAAKGTVRGDLAHLVRIDGFIAIPVYGCGSTSSDPSALLDGVKK